MINNFDYQGPGVMLKILELGADIFEHISLTSREVIDTRIRYT